MNYSNLIGTLIFLIQSSSFAFLALPATSSSCGPYPYAQHEQTGEISYLSIFQDYQLSKGYIISNEQAKLKSFVSEWAHFFEKNGEAKFQFRTYCYGHYDDENSTGPNALAYGDTSMLIGTSFKAEVRDSINRFISEKLQTWNPNQRLQVLQYSSSASIEFVLFHEYAHLLQNINQIAFTGPTDKMKELSADCIGSFLQTLKQIKENGNINIHATLSSSMYAYALGDGNTESKSHHGYPEERQTAHADGMRIAINMRNKGIDLNKIQSTQIIEACKNAGYR